jgi:hypothetical protein
MKMVIAIILGALFLPETGEAATPRGLPSRLPAEVKSAAPMVCERTALSVVSYIDGQSHGREIVPQTLASARTGKKYQFKVRMQNRTYAVELASGAAGEGCTVRKVESL